MAKMVRLLGLVMALGMIAASLGGCFPTVGGQVVTGSGRTTTTDYDFNDFTRVSVGSAFQTEITQGASYSVAVTVDDNLVEFLDVRVEGDTLHIGLLPRLSLGFRNMTLSARITMPDVAGLDLSGAVRGRVSGFNNQKPVEVEASGASQLRGDITTGEMRVEASGASTVELTGSTGRLDANASGASTIRFDTFTSEDTDVRASGASNVTVNASGRLTGDASGASTVAYIGNPSGVQVQTSGASNVRQK